MTAKGLTGRALGEAVIDHVLTFPESHDQEDFQCGTTGCIAGWAVILHGGISGLDVHEYARSQGHPDCEAMAQKLLGLNAFEFENAVVYEMDRDQAISNFKHLLDETHSEQVS